MPSNAEVNEYCVLKWRWCEYQQLLNATHSHSIANTVATSELISLFIRFILKQKKKKKQLNANYRSAVDGEAAGCAANVCW